MVSPEILRRYSLFAGLDPEAFKEIALFSDELHVADGEWLFLEGAKAEFIYLIVDGAVELTLDLDEEGKQKTEVETLVTGEAVGWSVLVEPHIYKMSAMASGDCNVIKINGTALLDMLASNPAWGFIIMSRIARIIGERLNNMRTRFVSMVP